MPGFDESRVALGFVDQGLKYCAQLRVGECPDDHAPVDNHSGRRANSVLVFGRGLSILPAGLDQTMDQGESVDLDELGKSLSSAEQNRRQIQRVLVEVLNPAVIGKRVVDLDMVSESNCQLTRVLVADRLVPVSKDYTIQEGDHLWLIGRAFRLPPVIALLGRESD